MVGDSVKVRPVTDQISTATPDSSTSTATHDPGHLAITRCRRRSRPDCHASLTARHETCCRRAFDPPAEDGKEGLLRVECRTEEDYLEIRGLVGEGRGARLRSLHGVAFDKSVPGARHSLENSRRANVPDATPCATHGLFWGWLPWANSPRWIEAAAWNTADLDARGGPAGRAR